MAHFGGAFRQGQRGLDHQPQTARQLRYDGQLLDRGLRHARFALRLLRQFRIRRRDPPSGSGALDAPGARSGLGTQQNARHRSGLRIPERPHLRYGRILRLEELRPALPEGAALHHGLQPGLDEYRRHAQPRLGDFALDGSHPEEGLHPQRQSLLLPQQGGAGASAGSRHEAGPEQQPFRGLSGERRTLQLQAGGHLATRRGRSGRPLRAEARRSKGGRPRRQRRDRRQRPHHSRHDAPRLGRRTVDQRPVEEPRLLGRCLR